MAQLYSGERYSAAVFSGERHSAAMFSSSARSESTYMMDCLQDKVAVSTLSGEVGLVTSVDSIRGKLIVAFFLHELDGDVRELTNIETRRYLASELVVIQSSAGIPNSIYNQFASPNALSPSALDKVKRLRTFLLQDIITTSNNEDEINESLDNPVTSIINNAESPIFSKGIGDDTAFYVLHSLYMLNPEDKEVDRERIRQNGWQEVTPRLQVVSMDPTKQLFNTISHAAYPDLIWFKSENDAREAWQLSSTDDKISLMRRLMEAKSTEVDYRILPEVPPDFLRPICETRGYLTLRLGERLVFDTESLIGYVLKPLFDVSSYLNDPSTKESPSHLPSNNATLSEATLSHTRDSYSDSCIDSEDSEFNESIASEEVSLRADDKVPVCASCLYGLSKLSHLRFKSSIPIAVDILEDGQTPGVFYSRRYDSNNTFEDSWGREYQAIAPEERLSSDQTTVRVGHDVEGRYPLSFENPIGPDCISEGNGLHVYANNVEIVQSANNGDVYIKLRVSGDPLSTSIE